MYNFLKVKYNFYSIYSFVNTIIFIKNSFQYLILLDGIKFNFMNI
jgi:hypothetical protein